MNTDYIYLVEAPAYRLTKIGFSNSPRNRVKAIQKATPTPVKLYALYECGHSSDCTETLKRAAFIMEHLLHSYYAKDWRGLEWFSRTAPEIEQDIVNLELWSVRRIETNEYDCRLWRFTPISDDVLNRGSWWFSKYEIGIEPFKAAFNQPPAAEPKTDKDSMTRRLSGTFGFG